MSKIFVYVRMSHRSSAESGISEAAQISAAQRYIEGEITDASMSSHCYPEDAPPGYFIDRGKSAWKRRLVQRAGGLEMLTHVMPGDHIVFYNVERGYRTVAGFVTELEALIERGVHVHFITERLNFATAAGKMIGRMMAVMAEYYSDMISERTKEALRIKRMTGSVGKSKDPRRYSESTVYVPAPAKKESKPTGKIRVYIRCSHADSEESGLGLQAQRMSCLRYAARLAETTGMEVHPELYEDITVSAFKNPLHKRESGARLLADLEKGDHVVTYRCDRMFRIPHDCAVTAKSLKQSGIFVHLVDCGITTANEMGELYLNMLAVFASIESQIKSCRHREVADIQRKSGRSTGSVPLHCKLVIEDGKKKLQYDKDKLARIVAVYIAFNEFCVSTVKCSLLNKLLLAKQTGAKVKDSIKVNGCLGTERLWRNRWRDIEDHLPDDAVNEILEKAKYLLTCDLPGVTEAMRRYVGHPFPVESRSIDVQSLAALKWMTPSQRRSSNAAACTASRSG